MMGRPSRINSAICDAISAVASGWFCNMHPATERESIGEQQRSRGRIMQSGRHYASGLNHRRNSPSEPHVQGVSGRALQPGAATCGRSLLRRFNAVCVSASGWCQHCNDVWSIGGLKEATRVLYMTADVRGARRIDRVDVVVDTPTLTHRPTAAWCPSLRKANRCIVARKSPAHFLTDASPRAQAGSALPPVLSSSLFSCTPVILKLFGARDRFTHSAILV
jgi:hypothetical protein